MSGAVGRRVLGGKYALERVLAVGGMGEVWLARHVELHSEVAVKLMSPGLLPDPAALERFRREARAAARLRTQHVVTVHDFGEQQGTPYLVMELLEGETLQERLARVGTVSLIEAAALVQQACAGLSVAHAQGIVHRDIKPSNLFLAAAPSAPLLKILDFGIAHAALEEENTRITRSGTIVGSPAFMSPEQANGEPVTLHSDLWSLAAVTYRMTTGQEPFRAKNVSETLARIRSSRFTPPTRVLPDLPRSFDDFFARAFAIELCERFPSADAFSAAFSAEVEAVAASSSRDGVHVVALGRDSLTRNLPRRTSDHRLWRVLLGVTALAGLLTISWHASRMLVAAPSPAASDPVETSLPRPALTNPTPAPPAARGASFVEPPPTQAAERELPPRAVNVDRVPARRVARTGRAAPASSSEPRPDSPTAIDPLFGLPVSQGQVSHEAAIDSRSSARK